MRKTGEWMAKWDERILDFIFENKSGTPSTIADHEYIHISKQYASTRLSELADHGLLDPLGNGVYMLTKEGYMYLAGTYDAQKEEYVFGDYIDRMPKNYNELGAILDKDRHQQS